MTASSLNVRAKPSLRAKVVDGLPRDTIVTADRVSADQLWRHVTGPCKPGWCYAKYLEPAGFDWPWMQIALAELGQAEVPGSGSNPRIVEYLRSTKLDPSEQSQDETAWCSAFVNWCVERAGYAGTDSAWALDWRYWGKESDPPRIGCIAVMTRGTAGGHVGFYLGQHSSAAKTRVSLLGGNQSDRVCVSEFPFERFVAFREPR